MSTLQKVDFEESQTIEFKESFASSSGRWLEQGASFVNTLGGKIYFGIKKNREVIGVNVGQDRKDSIQQSFAELEEPINVTFDELELFGKKVFVVNIPKGHSIPHFLSGTVWVRSSAITRAATKEEITNMIKNAGYIQFEKQPVRTASINDIDKEKVDEFISAKTLTMKLLPPNLSLEQTLINLDAGVEENGIFYPTTTGLLFFGLNPQKFVSYNRITIARYRGTVPVEFIDKADLNGTLPDMIKEIEKFIRRNIRNSAQIVNFERVEIPEYPMEAIREGIVNAIAHKEYATSKTPIQISIFDDRIDITNPGVPNIPTSELEGTHITRNEIICRLLKDAGYMEAFATGIRRMKDTMKTHGLPEPVLAVYGDIFKLTFLGPKEDMVKIITPVRRDLRKEGLNDRQIKALSYIYEHGMISHKEYCALFTVSNFTAFTELNDLMRKDLVSQQGTGIDSTYVKKD